MNDNQFKQFIERIDSLVKAFAIFSIKDLEDKNQKMWLIHAMGLSNSDIALIMNTTKNYVSKTLSSMRVEKSRSKGDENE